MQIQEWQIASQTHCGNVRKVNEDALLVTPDPLLLVIADGMGGHKAGDLASQMLISSLQSPVSAGDLASAARQVTDTILATNSSIIDYSAQHLNGQIMGSTVVAMLCRGSQGICLWAGDSRLYRASQGKLSQLTEDHSYVAELVRAGVISSEEAIGHPSSNVITRTVGADRELNLDQLTFEIHDQDTFLLCSDGLYNEVNDTEILHAMQTRDIDRASDWLLNLCLHRTAKDNVSFILARAHQQTQSNTDVTVTYYPGAV